MSSSSSGSASGGTPKALFGYDVIAPIGEGAGSSIYAVSEPVTGQIYALKHVVREKDKDIRFVEQLEAEHEVGQLVRHPSLRRTVDLKINKNLLLKVNEAALIMELFDGRPLEFVKPRTLIGQVEVFIQTARALDALHALGYVHCDLKPNNILLNEAGEVKVIDLGQAAKQGTKKSRIQGTPDYIAPEQVQCNPVTFRTDVFNLGATMYWATCGKKLPTLFTVKQKENSFLLDAKIDPPAAINPDVPEPLSNLVMECVKTSPVKRPKNMNEVASRLETMRHALAKTAPGVQSRATA
ncbi:MAG TPA: serine/threonine-protein kinase [Tepidisphaeraceae bacterium]|nr:serine/threonine-protein kinase [Tepidisphaeraceae bacterium]